MIVVAIDNDGFQRMNEYSAWKYKESNIPGMQFGGKGVEYGEFVMEVVKPFIDQEYRALADREHTAMIGSSLGGNITQFLGLEYQDQIGCLGVFSSANWLHQDAFNHYIERKNVKKKFGVSMQHYTFAVNAFVEMVKQFGMDEYEFAVRETKTYEVIKDVKDFHSEIGILYLNEFNKKVLSKMLQESGLEFHPLLECGIYVYMWKGHPLADKEEITIEELEEYPCLSFEQGEYNSFYFAEEVLSTYEYKRLIKANDRATMLNLMVGLNGYTLCSGIICESLNGDDYCAVKLKSDELMTIGYIKRKGVAISPLGEKYLEEIKKYKAMGDESGYKDILF